MKSDLVKMCFLTACLFAFFLSYAQTKRIKGKVFDEDAQPLSGVTILIKGKNVGTQTNSQGEFGIDAVSGETLVFSYTGFSQQELRVGNATFYSIGLIRKADILGEVVVVGYGTQTRREVSGAVTTVNSRAFENSPSTNVATVLQGNTPGLRIQQRTGQPGTTPSISFRGGTEFGGGGSPLFIVDGIIVPSLYGIDINDVASIDLLKDAASTAIYGARAANGVILLTTKKGKKGKSQVSYTFGHTANFIRPNSSEYLSAADYIRMNRFGLQARFKADSLDNNTNAMNTDRGQLVGAWGWAVNNGWTSASGLYTTQLVSNQNRYLLNKAGWKLLIDPNPFNPSQIDSLLFTDITVKEREALLLQKVTTVEHNLNFSGGNEQGNFALSLGTVKDDGMIIGSYLKRVNMNFNGALNVAKNLKINTNINAYGVQQGLPYGGFGSVDPEGGAAGGLMQRYIGVAPTVRYKNDTSGAILPGPNDVTLGNPLYWSNLTINSTDQQRFLGGVNIEYTVLPYLKLLVSGSGYYQYTNNNFFTKAYQQGNNGAFNTNRTASFNNTKISQYTTNAFLQFNKSFNGHALTILSGAEFYDYKSYANSGFSQGAPTDLIPWMAASTPPSVLGTTIINPAGASSNFNAWERITSGITRVNYSYKNRYLFMGIVRVDGSSRLSRDNYFGTFPGVSVGWNVHNESFYQKTDVSKFITSIKPRISYGVNGNVNSLGFFGTSQVFNNAGTYNGIGGTYVASYINSNVRWERTNSLNIGADIGFWKDRVMINADYFVRNVFDKIASLGVSSQTGFGGFTTNLGQLQNRGFEIAVNAKLIEPKTTDGLALEAGINIFHVKSFAKKLPFNGLPGNRQGTFQVWDPKNPGQLMQVGGLVEGKRIGLDEVWAPKWSGIYRSAGEIAKDAGVFNVFLPYGNKRIKQLGDASWHQVNKNDTIDSRQFVYVGRTTPQYMGGFNLSAGFKGFRLYAGFDYAFGFVILNNEIVRGLSQVQGSQNSTSEVLNTWTPNNPNAGLPRFYWANHGRNYATDASGNNPAVQLWEKGDYIMLRELAVSHDLSSKILSKCFGNKIKGLSINLTGTNLTYITGYSGNFPEVGGFDQGKFPLPKRLTFSIRAIL